jgi:alkyl hydroperoxide reductase subunit AhpC
MGLHIGSIAPDFTAESSDGTIRFHEYLGNSWGVLFSHPKDFTPVCTTEFGAVARLKDEWARRGVKVLGVSVDGVEEHGRWKEDIKVAGGASPDFPIAADHDLSISKAFDMLPAEAYLPEGRTPNDTATVRAVFIVGPDRKLKLSMTYPLSVGRNFSEILRAIDALQTAAGRGVATPADWSPGDPVIIPVAVSNEDARAKFGDYETVLPYLRRVRLG